MNGKYYAICLAAVLVMLGAAMVPAGLNANLQGTANGHENNSTHAPDDNNETENETAEAAPALGGGGWFMVTVGNVIFKDTFGMSISMNASSSEFVFQGRDASVRVHSLNFTKVSFSNNNTTVSALGWCTVNGSKGFWFNLTAMDLGNRSSDMLQLRVYKDVNKTGVMDETTPTWQWTANGLGGGQIGNSSGNESNEAADNDHDDEDRSVHEDSLFRHHPDRNPHLM